MLKPVLVATAVLALAGSSIVYAQQQFGGADEAAYGDGPMRFEQRHRPSAADMAAFTDARIAALKAGLELTPDQAKLRLDRVQARESGQQGQGATTPFEWLAQRADNMAKTGAALKHVAETGAPLYQSLDDAQKHRFMRLAHMLRPHHHPMHGQNDGDRPGWRQGYGYGPDGDWRQGPGFRPGERTPQPQLQNLIDNDDQASEL